MTDRKKIEEVLTRGVEEILPSRKRLADLMQKRKIRIYFGIDPTSPNLHLGHSIPLRKLRQFQDLGHKVVFLVGDFTASIGDPSENGSARKPMTPGQIEANMRDYKKQASRILDISRVEVAYNSQWFSKMKLSDFIKLLSRFTVSRLLERDMFAKRMQQGRHIWLSELLYPVLQGYDSVALDVDLEIGSTDQTFNMLVGRRLQKLYRKKEKFILTTPMLPGPDGRKMSKSFGNTINLSDSPEEIFGKIMSLKDELMEDYFKLCTDIPLEQIKGILNPRDAKEKLAFEIVSWCWGKKEAAKAKKEFRKIFRERELPSKIKKVALKQNSINILELLIKIGFASSRSEAKRLLKAGGVKINNKIVSASSRVVDVRPGMIIQKGKKDFVRLS